MPQPSFRHYDALDRLLMRLQPPAPSSSHAVTAAPHATDRSLSDRERRQAADLMRVNHAGEVSAQALYHGQALVARNEAVRKHLLQAAAEEQQHLDWCRRRLDELQDRPSHLDPLWYGGSLVIGAIAGLAGDAVSLGFVEETEAQVAAHLDDHLKRLPEHDIRSRKVIEAMKADEERHGREAREAGGRPLPQPMKRLMSVVAGFMKFGAARI